MSWLLDSINFLINEQAKHGDSYAQWRANQLVTQYSASADPTALVLASAGQVAYGAYSASMNGKAVDGSALSPWAGLSAQAQASWNTVASAVLALKK